MRGARSGATAWLAGATLALLLAAAPPPAAATGPIRVAVQEAVGPVEVEAAGRLRVLDAGTRRPYVSLGEARGPRLVRVQPAAAGLELSWGAGPRERRTVAFAAVRLEAPGAPLRVGGREYGGALEVWRGGPGLLLINELGLEEYVAGTVRAETPEGWPLEALRAVAVAARTYAAFARQRNAGKPYHLVATVQDQKYDGRAAEGAPAGEAARTTAGQVLTWQGGLFPAFYHADSGGVTEPPRSVFAGEDIPPLPGVRDEFSTDSPYAAWTVTLPAAALAARLRQAGYEVGEVRGLAVLERAPSLRVLRLQVDHTGGALVLRGTDFRRAVGYDVLRSTLFVPVVEPDGRVRFEGRGWGHGVGLSQFGARGMAERGYTYVQILAYYYPGTVLGSLR